MSRFRSPYDRRRADSYAVCPWCGLTNYSCGTFYKNGRDGETTVGYYWNGYRRALDAGNYAKLWTRKGRIYGGARRKRKWGRDEPAPVRVNEKFWMIVRSGPRLLIACAHPFHEDRTK